MQNFVLKGELRAPAEHSGVNRVLSLGVVEDEEVATELLGMVRAVYG